MTLRASTQHNDRDQLLRTIENNPGGTSSALEAINEKSSDLVKADERGTSAQRDAECNPAITASLAERAGLTRRSFQFDPTEQRVPQLPVSEKDLGLSL